MRRLATALLFADNGNILLQDRTTISKFGETCGPFGGSIEAGETPVEAIRRELREELGIVPKQLFQLGRYAGVIGGTEYEEFVFFGPAPKLEEICLHEGGGYFFADAILLREGQITGFPVGYKSALEDFTKYWTES